MTLFSTFLKLPKKKRDEKRHLCVKDVEGSKLFLDVSASHFSCVQHRPPNCHFFYGNSPFVGTQSRSIFTRAICMDHQEPERFLVCRGQSLSSSQQDRQGYLAPVTLCGCPIFVLNQQLAISHVPHLLACPFVPSRCPASCDMFACLGMHSA